MQVADFGKDTSSWEVDKIIDHHGSSKNAIFQVQWKSGAVTWMPYNHISHLKGLTDYLDLLEVDSINKLTSGKGNPPDDLHIYTGCCEIKHQCSTHQAMSCPKMPSDCCHQSQQEMAQPYCSPDNLWLHNFTCVRDDFVMDDNSFTGSKTFMTKDQLLKCIEYSSLIQNKNNHNLLSPSPLGYHNVAYAFNGEDHPPYQFSLIGDDGQWIPNRQSKPDASIFYGNSISETTTTMVDCT